MTRFRGAQHLAGLGKGEKNGLHHENREFPVGLGVNWPRGHEDFAGALGSLQVSLEAVVVENRTEQHWLFCPTSAVFHDLV